LLLLTSVSLHQVYLHPDHLRRKQLYHQFILWRTDPPV
ncbi:hypothetical protein GCK32_016772, partial [Trichostrongylus colubriformis]